MDQDTPYENIELEVVQSGEAQLDQQYASLQNTKASENIYQDIQTVKTELSVNTATQLKKETKITNGLRVLWVFAITIMVISILCLVLIIIIAGVYIDMLQEKTATLTRQMEDLENRLNQTMNTTMVQLGSLQSTVDSLDTTQLNSLQSTVDTLTTQVNSPVNLYQNCIQETKSCSFETSGSKYWKSCYTDYIPINATGYHTADIRCEYEAHSTHFIQESHILRKSGSRIQCQCHISKLTETSPSHIVINIFSSTCSILVTRCPQTL